MLARGPVDEPLVKVVDEIAGAPVELCPDGRHVRRRHPGHHEAAPRRRQQVDEGVHVPRLLVDQVRVEQHRRQSGDDPRPRAKRVVRDLEEERRQDAVSLRLRAEDALCDVPATPRLGAGIPGRPPLHREEDRQREERHPGIGNQPAAVRRDRQRQHRDRRRLAAEVRREAGLEGAHPADRAHREHRQHDHRRHLDHELDQVRPEHRPHPGRRRIGNRHDEADRHRHDVARHRQA